MLFQPPLKKSKTAPLLEKHCLISCIYSAQVNNGGFPQIAKQTSIINFRSSNSLADILNPNIYISPKEIQSALTPQKASALIEGGYLKCVNCTKEASHVCSSIMVSRGTNKSHSSEQFQVLLVSEDLITSCSNHGCIFEARRRRNHFAAKKGCGLSFVFRCALEPITAYPNPSSGQGAALGIK